MIERFWIEKKKDRELYRKIQREAEKIRGFVTEQLGWKLIANEKIIKLEKIPTHAKGFMGVTQFTRIQDYIIFCALLIYLEEREEGEQFLLSEMLEVLETQLQEYMEVDWTMYAQRRSLVRVLQVAENRGLLKVNDGNSERVADGTEREVLYENTGLSRYFAVNFGRSIETFSSCRDFEAAACFETDTEQSKTQRVYRHLVTAPAFYWISTENKDASYLKAERMRIQRVLGEKLGGSLHLHRNAAFYVYEEERMGELHPEESMLSEVVLTVCKEIRKEVENRHLERDAGDCVSIFRREFQGLVRRCQEREKAVWNKEFGEMEISKLERGILEYMKSWMLAELQGERVIFYPACGKFIGSYLTDFVGEEDKTDE